MWFTSDLPSLQLLTLLHFALSYLPMLHIYMPQIKPVIFPLKTISSRGGRNVWFLLFKETSWKYHKTLPFDFINKNSVTWTHARKTEKLCLLAEWPYVQLKIQFFTKKQKGKRNREERNEYWEVTGSVATEGEISKIEWESKGKEEVSRMARFLALVPGRRVFLLCAIESYPNILPSRFMYFKIEL